MIRPQKFNLANLLYLIPVIILLLFASLPLTVTGQGPVEETPEPTVAPLSNFFYMPLISKAPPCEAPLLETPPAEALLAADQPITFSWRKADDCLTEYQAYTLQIATDPTFAPDSIFQGVGSRLYGDKPGEAPYYETNYVLTYTVPGTYYWRATTTFSDTQGVWSEPRRFTVVSTMTQLLVNASFETDPDQIDPWQWLRPEETTYRIAQDPQVAYEGERFLAVNRQDEIPGNKSFYQEIESPQPETTYHFALWVRASAEALEAGRPRTGRLALWAFGGAAPREHGTHNFAIDQPGWRCIETSLTVAAAGHARLRAEVYLTALDEFDYYFDNAVLRDDGQATCPPRPPVTAGDATLVSEGQGFDTCAAPGVAQLAAWKQASPYEYIGVYLGGVSHYLPCAVYNQQSQTGTWFSAVAQQGWRFIPIWVGPQAPCSTYAFRLSDDPDVAWREGVAEARQSLAAAAKIGLLTAAKPATIIYYDMEYYPPHDPTCHAAVKAFLSGWVSELQSQGHQAGLYSSAFIANEWYRLLHVPDSIWTAWYMRDGYDPEVTIETVNQEWITPSYWDNHRLFQYSNSHDETWGGATLNIDNDAARGLVALGGAALEQNTLHQMGLVAPNQGWLWLDHRLLWTATGGEQWTDITPPVAGAIEAVLFLDESRGWAASTTAHRSQVRLWRTTDGGRQWQSSAVDIFGRDETMPIGAIHLDFIDSDTGWLVVKLATGVNFSRGLLFKTEDGGATWDRLSLPLGEPVRFVTETMGWTAGGPTNSELYVTRDGGRTWQAQAIVPPAAGPAAYTLPVFDDEQTGLIAATIYEASQAAVAFYLTQDGGQTWQRREHAPLTQSFALGASPSISILNSQQWVVADPDLTPTFPQDIVSFAWAASTTGWAHVRDNVCAGRCEQHSRLFQTTDAGQTWTEIVLP